MTTLRTNLLGLLIGAALLSPCVVRAQAPVNDTCAGALALAEGTYFYGNVQYAGDETNYPCIGVIYRSVWFTYTPLVTGTATVMFTTDVGGNSRIEIDRGTCGALVPVACQDKVQCSGCGVNQRSFRCNAGETYLISVGASVAAPTWNFSLLASAVSEPHATVTVTVSPPVAGSAWGGGFYLSGSTVEIGATAASGWMFSQWIGGNASNPRSVVVPITNTAYVAVFTQQVSSVAVAASPANGGSVSGGGTNYVGSNLVLTATAAGPYLFAGWSDGNPNNPRTVTVQMTPVTYTANFVHWSTNVLAIASVVPVNGLMTWSSTSGFVYDVQWSTDVSAADWQGDWREMTGIVATGAVTTVRFPLFLRVAQRP